MSLAPEVGRRQQRGRLRLQQSGVVQQHRPDPAAAAGWTVDPVAAPADPALIARIGAGRCLRLGLLPWHRLGGATQRSVRAGPPAE